MNDQRESNKEKMDALFAKLRKRGWFPISCGRTFKAHKCSLGCGVSVLSFKNKRGKTKHVCFRCGK